MKRRHCVENAFLFQIRKWNFRNLFYNLKTIICNFKFAWQRATRGYCDPDVWELGDHFCELMSDMLEELAENHRGYPKILIPNGELWTNILREMAKNFYCATSDFEDDMTTKEIYDRQNEAFDKAIDTLKTWRRDLWD